MTETGEVLFQGSWKEFIMRILLFPLQIKIIHLNTIKDGRKINYA